MILVVLGSLPHEQLCLLDRERRGAPARREISSRPSSRLAILILGANRNSRLCEGAEMTGCSEGRNIYISWVKRAEGRGASFYIVRFWHKNQNVPFLYRHVLRWHGRLCRSRFDQMKTGRYHEPIACLGTFLRGQFDVRVMSRGNSDRSVLSQRRPTLARPKFSSRNVYSGVHTNINCA